MKLSVGKIAFPIEFDNGDKDVIYFNPNDPELSNRMLSTSESMEKRMKDVNFGEFSLNSDGNVEMPANINDISELSDEQEKMYSEVVSKMHILSEAIKDETDYIFNSNVSDVLYKHCSPLAIINGNFFYRQIFENITPEIKKYIDKSYEIYQDIEIEHLKKYMENK